MKQNCYGKWYSGCCSYSGYCSYSDENLKNYLEDNLMESNVNYNKKYFITETEKIEFIDLENTLMSTDFENNMMIEFQVSYKDAPRVFYTYEMTKSEFLNTFMPTNKDRIDYIKCQKI